MKGLLITITALFITIFSFAGKLEVYFDYKLFSNPTDNSSYVETHLEFNGRSLYYQTNDASMRQANVQVMILIKKGEEIIDYRKLQVEGPMVGLNESPDFLDIQRFPIEAGDYEFELEFLDLNDPESKSISHFEKFQVAIPENDSYISDIILVTAYAQSETSDSELAHSGYDLLPFVSDYFPSNVNSLIFYAEVYQTDKEFKEEGAYVLSYFLRNESTKQVQSNQGVVMRKDVSSVVPILATFDLTEFPVGDYELCIEVRNKQNELKVEKVLPFFRQKIVETGSELIAIDEIEVQETFAYAIKDRDVLMDYILSCRPKATNVERTTIDHQIPYSDISLMQKFFYYFWYNRNEFEPEKAWAEYKLDVEKVNAEYSTSIKRGYESDRGRVYLQYGAPNSIAVKHNNMSVYPYEVWHYYSIGEFSNKRFLFYNQDIVSNDFALLTSDMWGEVKNNNWIEIMSGRNMVQTPTIFENVDSSYSNTGDAEIEILKDLYFHTR